MTDVNYFIAENGIPENNKMLPALKIDIHEEHPRNNQAQNTSVTKLSEDFTTQVSEEIEGKDIRKLTRETSKTESRILGALSWLDQFLLYPLIQSHSRTVPKASRNT